MLGDPPAALLVAEARRALEDGLAPGFPQKVAANALGIAQREIELGPPSTVGESARLEALFGPGDLREANGRLCAAIRSGELALDDDHVLAHLIHTAVEAIAIDQPGYAAFKAWREGGAELTIKTGREGD